MPQARVGNATVGQREELRIELLSQLSKAFQAKQVNDCMVIVIPDTGKAEFNGSHLIKTGKSAGKMSKATLVIGELGSSYAGVLAPWTQGEGDAKGLDVYIKASVIAAPPNKDATCIEDALFVPVKTPLGVPQKDASNGQSTVIQ